MFQKILAMVFCAIASAGAYAADPGITDVHAQQRYPWNGKVDIQYTVVGDVASAMSSAGLSSPTIVVSAKDNKTSIVYAATAAAVTGDARITEGTHRITWDMALDGYTFKSDEVTFKVAFTGTREVVPTSAPYCVIDLAAGTTAESYPVTYMSAPPEGGFNTDEYKTTKLVLKLVDAGTFTMGSENTRETNPPREETIAKAFYCGMFEVTQKQYFLLTGNDPSANKGDTRPVEKVNWDLIAGSTVLGALRTKTGLDFNLPTEMQWEYACRAGTSTDFNNGGSTEEDLAEVARYSGNQNDGKGGYSSAHTTVGSYQPNAWGFYDMHGNVWEWCLDAYDTESKSYRGGSWQHAVEACRSSHRGYGWPSSWSQYPDLGFRLVVNPAD